MSKSIITKKEIARVFKLLMEEKTFESITVADIMAGCGLSRLTFYYHFEDKYALLNWIYYSEVIEVFKENLNFDTWDSNFEKALTTIFENKKYYINALAYDNNEFKRYMLEVAETLLHDSIEVIAEDKEIDEKEKKFIASFFAYGITGVIVEWAGKEMNESPKEMVYHVKTLVEDCKQLAIARYIQNKM